MFVSAGHLKGYHVNGIDGDVGHVESFLFDDQTWDVRYVVVETGPFFFNKKVLLFPQSVANLSTTALSVDLKVDAIKHSPPIDTDRPVSRQMEIELHRYYSWPFYWGEQLMDVPVPPLSSFPIGIDNRPVITQKPGNPHLRSTSVILGYEAIASDGNIGTVDDLIIDSGKWVIPNAVINIVDHFIEKKVIVSTARIRNIQWREEALHLDMSTDAIAQGTVYDPHTPVNRYYEEIYCDFYGKPQFWNTFTTL